MTAAAPPRPPVPPVPPPQDGPVEPVLPSREDPFVAATSTVVGGPVGRHARLRRRGFTVWRVLVCLVVMTCALGWAQKAQCRDTRNWQHGGGVYQYTRLCYSDVVALYGSEGVEAGRVPYVDQPVEYPVLIGAAMDLAGQVARLGSPSRPLSAEEKAAAKNESFSEDTRAALFYDATVLLMAAASLATVICTGLLAGRRRTWDAALVALAPALVVHLGTNWDVLAVALSTAALLLWARRRPALAGLLLGLGVAAKAYPLLFLVPLGLLCLRAGRLRAFTRTALTTVGTALAAYAVVWPFSPAFADQPGADGRFPVLGPSAWQALRHDGLGSALAALAPHHDGGSNGLLRFVTLNRTRPADFDTLWYALQRTPVGTIPTARLSLGVAGAVLLVVAGVAALALLAPRRPRLPQLLFLLVAGFLLTNKVFSPQYTLWLLPLAVLARPRWRAFLAWQATEVLLLVVRYGFFVNLSHSDRGAPYPWFLAAVLARDTALAVLAALVVREVLRPEHDVVRTGPDGAPRDDDPAGGVLDRAPDALLLSGPAREDPAPEVEPLPA